MPGHLLFFGGFESPCLFPVNGYLFSWYKLISNSFCIISNTRWRSFQLSPFHKSLLLSIISQRSAWNSFSAFSRLSNKILLMPQNAAVRAGKTAETGFLKCRRKQRTWNRHFQKNGKHSKPMRMCRACLSKEKQDAASEAGQIFLRLTTPCNICFVAASVPFSPVMDGSILIPPSLYYMLQEADP